VKLIGNVAVIDCVTLWLTNFFVDTENDVELSLELAKQNLTRSQIKKMQQL
jgi:adenosylcobinamide kinase/adenosylcobinamide-phosphate guanylyltransferase